MGTAAHGVASEEEAGIAGRSEGQGPDRRLTGGQAAGIHLPAAVQQV